ncbi:hypothetical protein MNBD_GAMMA05-902 [hydrothermal vent metagenome]|uniref:PD-(D/E)XK endonuclease-like domain-containing protein n=1 Tax=hydrothermal vent metagenome TaxID=652676 RepID=A0A3B0WMA0_9ZZZZ
MQAVMKPSIIMVPAHQNILQYAADYIAETFSSTSPDFSNISVLLPHAQASEQFNHALCRTLNSNTPAIIPPWSGTLKAWVKQFSHNDHADFQIISEQARQLLFIEALQQHPDLFKEENQWQVTQALLTLFDELSLNQSNLFDSEEEWQAQLQSAYGLEQQHEHLMHEAKLVYTLWHAWKTQLNENSLHDETGDYLSRLINASSILNDQQHFICLELTLYTKTEQDFVQTLIDKDMCSLFTYAKTMGLDDSADNTVYSAFINETFDYEKSAIKSRASQFKDQHPNATAEDIPFTTYLASSEEEQIRAIDYHVRLNVLNGNQVAIISEDRKLSRRLRALLERANIQLHDKAGWSLATTQAATIIERWLACIEEDFSAYPLLDCLKSPHINIFNKTSGSTSDSSKEKFKENIYRFEHDLVLHENVSSNINSYKRKLRERLKRLNHWPENAYDELIKTLDYIEDTAEPLVKHYSHNKNIQLSSFIECLKESLEKLGVIESYQADNAGLVLLKTFDELKQSTQISDPVLSWFDCRVWLAMELESQHFTPLSNNNHVQLMTLEQAALLKFDCIVFAATESQYFPGSANNHPFFNQSVRASLGLTTWDEGRKQRHELFNRTLLSAPNILLTACNEEKGEEKPVSPWLELLINFFQLAYDKTPENIFLKDLVKSNKEVFNCDEPTPPVQTLTPETAIPDNLLPKKISASSYQRIINCPYQFFSADGLKLKALEELSDELKKSGYGERIHLILQCFHSGHKTYGEAFPHELTEKNRRDAEHHLSTLSKSIFLSDLENNILHRSWLYRWQKHIPAYINWQIRHQQNWSIYLSEKNIEITLNESLTLYGRLDRIDKNKENNSHAIIDYKTGKTARLEDVENGENVQLSTYALLDSEATDVSYLSVDSSYQKVETKSSLSGDELDNNREENKRRLTEIFNQLKAKKPTPAWGDDAVCRYCNFSGLCRKQEWKV